MTPKEKAKDLTKKFLPHSETWDCYNDEPVEENHAKQCALIAVDEIIKENGSINYSYWQEVKQEINKL